MQTCTELPEGYKELFSINLQKDKKLAVLVNGLAVVIAVPLVLAGNAAVPISALFSMEKGMGAYLLRFAALMLGLLAYMALHELVHGVFMRLFSGLKPRYGFTGLYAYAGSGAYFDKRRYIVVALAPVVIWGAALLLLCPALPREWFWVGYLIQVSNLSGAAGDLYVTCRFSRLPADILVQDSGIAMTVYGRR